MSRRWFVLVTLLLVATPSILSARWIKDTAFLETQDVGKVEFSHFVHLEALGKNCLACHNKIYHIRPENNPLFTMKEMEKGKSCGACHNGRNAFSVKANCGFCHVGKDIAIDSDVGQIPFSHKVHTAAFDCYTCHPDLFKAQPGANQATMKQMEGGASCGACHDGSTAFSVKENCETCHVTKELTIEAGVGEIPFSHKLHTAAFGCDACHPATFKARQGVNRATKEQMIRGASCGACHDGSTAFSVRDKCAACHTTTRELAIDSPVGAIPFSHEFHTGAFGCDSCHPEPFKGPRGASKATMKQMEDGASCGACHDGSTAFSVRGKCDACHTTTRELAIDSPVGAIPFSHEFHTGAFGCDSCHPDLYTGTRGASKATMKQMEDGASCGACHDGGTAFSVKGNCTSCHPTKELVFDSVVGKTPFSHKVHAGAFGCDSCHPAPYKAQTGVNSATMKQMEKGASCGSCHDGGTAFSVKGDCATCHITSEVVFKSVVGPIPFSHKVHTGDFGCDSCHPAPYKARKGVNTASMKQMEQGASCGACHDGSTAFSVKKDCATCHPTSEIVYETEVGRARFSHAVHTGAFGCDSCHPAPFRAEKGMNKATMKQMEQGKSCGACHDGNTAFTVKSFCADCHEK